MRNTIASDLNNYGELADKTISDCKNSTAYKVFYGKADYGYFVQVYCNDYVKDRTNSFNVDTKAGAKYIAEYISKALSLPLDSDWEALEIEKDSY